jgi:hypothetical protein
MHPLVAAILLRMPRLDALDRDAEAQPPNREFAQAVERMRRREGHAVVGPNRAGQPKLLEGALEDGEGEFLLRRRQRFTRQQVPARKSVIVSG